MGDLYGPFMDSFWVKNIIPIIILLLEMATQNIKLLNGYVSSTLQPTMDGMANLGSSSLRFNSIFANTVVGSVSDPQIESNTLLFPFTAPYTHRLTTSANTITLDNNAGGNVRATILGDLTVGNSVITPTFQGNLTGNTISLTNGNSTIQFNSDPQNVCIRTANTLANRPGLYLQSIPSTPFQTLGFNMVWNGSAYNRDNTSKWGYQISCQQSGPAGSDDTMFIRGYTPTNSINEMMRFHQGDITTSAKSKFTSQTLLAPRYFGAGNALTDAILTQQQFTLVNLLGTTPTVSSNVITVGSCIKLLVYFTVTGNNHMFYLKYGGTQIAQVTPGVGSGYMEFHMFVSNVNSANNTNCYVACHRNGVTFTVLSKFTQTSTIDWSVSGQWSLHVTFSNTQGNIFMVDRFLVQPFV